jgi:RecB family exonuclease
VISPRRFALLRVPDLRSFRRVVVEAVSSRAFPGADCAVIVPTAAAAELLRPAFSDLRRPDIVTREGLYSRIHERLGNPPLLSQFDRHVLMRRAARAAAEEGLDPPFRLRPGLIGEMLSFYDELHRRARTLDSFERLVVEALEPSAEIDRGAARLLAQTRFFAAAFRDYERRTGETGMVDEHGLRRLALTSEDFKPHRHVIVTVPDQTADPYGLWVADIDLLGRLQGIVQLDVVATERLLATGFHQRIHDLLPGIEETMVAADSLQPILAVSSKSDSRVFVSRDREEELADFVRDVKRRVRSGEAPRTETSRIGIVFQRPLPYLYLARHVFADARVAWRALDQLPLAAEPFGAAIDLVLSFVTGGYTRAAGVALLRSPHFLIAPEGEPVGRHDIAALDRALMDARFVGGRGALESIAARLSPGPARAARALTAAARELDAVTSGPTAADQIGAIAAFVRTHDRPAPDAVADERRLLARQAILDALDALAGAHERLDNSPLEVEELAGAIRRWIESQTFSPRVGDAGIQLMDAAAARYGDFDEIRIVGLVESDWPDRSTRSIFYPSSLLNQLGWTPEADRLAAARAAFADLLQLPSARVSASAFMLEDDGLVALSALVEEIDGAGLRVVAEDRIAPGRMFVHEALTDAAEIDAEVLGQVVTGTAAEWLAARRSRTPASDRRYHGSVGSYAPDTHSVSASEQYLACPFKYFAANVLDLEEEQEEQAGLTSLERGQFVHEVLREFFAMWQRSGRGAITVENLAAAVEEFKRIAEARLETLPEADRALERNHLLGSAAASGLAERAFAFELERRTPIVERLLEHRLEGRFVIRSGARSGEVQLRGKADRIDVLTDRSIRVIDYKLRKAPASRRALQLPIYAAAATQALAKERGGEWRLAEAGYVAFGERQAFVRLGGRQGDEGKVADALESGQALFLDTVEAIERGEFPVSPDEPFMCRFCAFPSVCRKDYVGDE